MHRVAHIAFGCIVIVAVAPWVRVFAADNTLPALQYQQLCSVCHGEQGDGQSRASQGLRPPPRDFTAADFATKVSRESMIASVRDGRPGTAMSAWRSRLDNAQIASIVDYVRSQFMRVSSQPKHSSRGEAIYAQTCSVCHGEQGNGAAWGRSSLRPVPRDFTSESSRTELTQARMMLSVKHGRSGTAMAAWSSRLSNDDIAVVVDYIRTAFMHIAPDIEAASNTAKVIEPSQHAPESGIAGMAAALPDGLIGDIVAGRMFYQHNCAECHGLTGDGNGPRAYFIFPKPRNFLHPGAQVTLNRPHLFAATKNGVVGREMPAWGKVLSNQEIANVSEYVFQAFIRRDTEPVDAVTVPAHEEHSEHDNNVNAPTD